MALRTLGTLNTTRLACLTNWSQVIPALDLDGIGAAITDDRGFGLAIMGVVSPSYVLATGSTAGTNVLSGVTARAGSPPIGRIRIGDQVLANYADIAPGTTVADIASGGAVILLSQPARSNLAVANLAFLRQDGGAGIGREALLSVPGRGMLKVLPGDIVAVDATGWPILLSANTVAYAGTDWTLT